MNSVRFQLSKFAFWTICFVAVCWAVGTVLFEVQAGIPSTPQEWVHRAMGWFVQVVLIRTFRRGVQRYYSVSH